MNITKLKTLEQFKALKKGDTILVRWGEAPYKSKKLMLYEIPEPQHDYNEIICVRKNNTYFNYKMHLGIDIPGVCTSNAKEVWKVED